MLFYILQHLTSHSYLSIQKAFHEKNLPLRPKDAADPWTDLWSVLFVQEYLRRVHIFRKVYFHLLLVNIPYNLFLYIEPAVI